jgi:predicted transcriptional regulator
MDTTNIETGHAQRPENDQERLLALETDMIAEARAAAAAGRVVSSEQVDAWIDSLDTDHELPPPHSDR